MEVAALLRTYRPRWVFTSEGCGIHPDHKAIEDHEALWGTQTFYRVFSPVNGGRELETDLFAGLR